MAAVTAAGIRGDHYDSFPVETTTGTPTVSAVRLGSPAAAWLELLRPVTLVPLIVISLLFGLDGAGGWPGTGGFLRVLLAGGLLTVLNGASNIWNQLGDWVEDSVHPTKSRRPLVAGRIDPLVAMSVAVLTVLASAVLAVLFLPTTFTLLYVVVAFFAWTYSYPPRMKARFPLNMAWIGTPRGGLGIVAAWSVLGSPWSPALWFVLFVTVPFVTLGNESRNIADRDADAYAGVSTVATRWGAEAARLVAGIGMVWPLLAAIALWVVRPDPWLLLWIPVAGWTAYVVERWPGERLWVFFYGSYAALCLLLALPALLA